MSKRTSQPGSDTSFREAETAFISALRAALPNDKYVITQHPRDLAKMFGGLRGVVPDASIRSRTTGRMLFFEVKKQGAGGNAEERACKHHTVQFQKALKSFMGYDWHPFFTVMCENLANDVRYTSKYPYLFEPGQYYL